jgi:hypothetical protein
MTGTPPPHVAAAAKVVESWVKEQETGQRAAPAARMSNAERLDRARQFDQKKMPPWKDPHT